MKGNYKIMKLQTVQEKMIRYCQILRHYGPKLTFAYYLTQQSDSKYYDFSKKVILDFVLKLRKEAQIDESSSEKKEFTSIPQLLLLTKSARADCLHTIIGNPDAKYKDAL